MALIRFNSFPTFNSFVDDFFADFNKPIRKTSVPAVNVLENENGFRLEVAAPGFNKENFKINLNDNILTVSGEQKTENNEKTERYTRKEFSNVSFKRSFTLPENINSEQIDAKYEEGILKVNLPKKSLPTPNHKLIDIQ